MSVDTTTVLIVDDEPSIREPLMDYLDTNGFSTTGAGNVKEARGKLATDKIDIVLLDVMMPGEDGLTLLREVRQDSSLPIILLTAMSEDTDRIVGLELGADDYVTKPFNPRELLARIKAVMRRTKTAGKEDPKGLRYEFAGFVMDTETRALFDADGGEISLTGGEFNLLLTMAEAAGRVLNRDQLLEQTQGREAHTFDRSIDNQISRLRRKIEADPKDPHIIKTVRGGGYVFAAKVHTL